VHVYALARISIKVLEAIADLAKISGMMLPSAIMARQIESERVASRRLAAAGAARFTRFWAPSCRCPT
jgi:hypothetical protein